MVGLYKDPSGESITTFPTSGPREEANESAGSKKDRELKNLRRRVNELESSLKEQVSYSLGAQVSLTNSYVTKWYIAIYYSIAVEDRTGKDTAYLQTKILPRRQLWYLLLYSI